MSDRSHGAQVLTEIEAMLANSPPTSPKTEHMPVPMVPEKLPEKAESKTVHLRFDSQTCLDIVFTNFFWTGVWESVPQDGIIVCVGQAM
jgi:hypothetical protein